MTPSLDDIQSDRMRSAGYDRQTIDRSLGGQQTAAAAPTRPSLEDPTAMRMAQREVATTLRMDAQAQREQNKQAAAASKLAAKQADPSYEPPEVTQARKIKNRMEEVERIKKRELKDFNSGAGSLITPDAKKKTGGELMNLEGYQTDAQDKTTGFLGIGGGSESDKAKAANQNINDLIAKAQRFDPSIKNADDLKRYRDTLSQQRDRITAEHDKIAGERQKWEKTYGDHVSQHYFPAGDGSVSAPAGATDRQPQSNESQAMPKTEDGRLSPDAIVRLTEMAKDHEHIAGMETTSDRLKQAVGVKAANLRKQAEDAVASYADRPDIQKQIVDATRDPTMSEKLKQGGLNVISAAETSLMDIPQFAVRQSNRLANAFGANINLDDNSAKNYMDAMQEVAKGHADGSDLPPAIKKKLDENWMVTDVARGVGSLAGMIGPGEVVGGLAELAKLGKVATAGEAAAAKAFGATAKNLTNLGAGSAATGNALRNEVIAANAPRMKAIDDQLAQQKITPAEHKQMANELQNQAGKAEALGSVLGLGLGAIGPLAESIGGMMQVPAGKAFAKVFMQTAAKDATGLTKFMQGPGRVLLDKTINSLGEGGSMAVINALTRMGENLAAQGSIPGMEGWDKSRGVMTGVDESSISGLITGTLLRGVREAATRNGMTLPVPEIGKDGKPVDPLAGKTINDLRDVVKTEDEFKTGEKPPEEPPAGAPVTPKPPDIPPTDAGLHTAVDTTGVTTPFDDALKPRTPEQIPTDTGLNTAVDTENVSTPFDEAVKRAKETPADVPSGQSVSEPSNEAAPAPLPPAVETAQGQSVIRDNLQKPTAPSAAVETSTPEPAQKAEVLGVKPAAEVQASAPVSEAAAKKADAIAKREAARKAASAEFEATKEAAKVEPAEPQKLGGKDIATRITNAEEKFISFARETAGLTRMQAIRALGEYKKSKAIKIDMNGGQYSFTDGRFAEADVLRRAAGESEAAKQPTSRPVESESDKAQAKKPTTPEPAPSAVKSSEKAFDKSVRDFPLRAIKKSDEIIVSFPRGGEKLTYSADEIAGMTEWDRKQFIYSKTSHWDEEPGGAGQAERLRDAVRNLMRQLVAPKPSMQDQIDANAKARAERASSEPAKETPVAEVAKKAPKLLPSVAIEQLLRSGSEIVPAGPASANFRQMLMSKLTGKQTPKAASGVNAVEAELARYLGVDASKMNGSERYDAIRAKLIEMRDSGKPAEAAKPAAKVEPVESAQGGKNETIKVINPYGLAPEGEKILTVSGKTIKLKAAPDLDFFAYKTVKNGYWTVVEKNTGSGLGGIAEKTRDAAIAKAEEKISQVGSKRMNELVAETAWLNKSKDAVESAPAEQPNAFAKVSDSELASKAKPLREKLAQSGMNAKARERLQTQLEKIESEQSRRRAEKAAAPASTKRIGYGSRKDGVIDIIDHINDLGGIPSPKENQRGGEYDGFEDFKKSGRNKLLINDTPKGGLDTWLDELNPMGGHKISTLGELQDAIDSALRAREKAKGKTNFDDNQGKIADVLLDNKGRTKKADYPRYLSDVGKGDTFTGNGEPFKVTDVKPDGTIVAQDGPKYGKIELPPDGKFFPDKGSFQKAPPTLEDPVVAKKAVEAKKPTPPAIGKAQTIDMFDSGKAKEDFALAGESSKDFTGNMDAKAKLAADKAEAEAAQGKLYPEIEPKGGKVEEAPSKNQVENLQKIFDNVTRNEKDRERLPSGEVPVGEMGQREGDKSSVAPRSLAEIEALMSRGIVERDQAVSAVGIYLKIQREGKSQVHQQYSGGTRTVSVDEQARQRSGISSPENAMKLLKAIKVFNDGGKMPDTSKYLDRVQMLHQRMSEEGKLFGEDSPKVEPKVVIENAKDSAKALAEDAGMKATDGNPAGEEASKPDEKPTQKQIEDAGFKSEKEARDAHEKEGLKKHNETLDEFLKRRDCQNPFLP